MERTVFLDHFRISEQGKMPVELRRQGAAITYKAVDTRNSEPVSLTLVPLEGIDAAVQQQLQERGRAAQLLDHINIERVFASGIDGNNFVYVSEYLLGETVGEWITNQGSMPPDAVLRIALQVVGALGAAAFHNIVHCAIQPSNLMIAPGQTAEGGWPFVKLVNFGIDSYEADRTMSLQFASPEQLADGAVDFRSQIFSLGTTMCFLLTGAIYAAEPRALQTKRFARPLRSLITPMLAHKPDERPQDPTLFALEIRNCLQKVERRQMLARKFGIPFIPVTARAPQRRKAPVLLPPIEGPRPGWSPRPLVSREIIAVIGLLIAAAALAAVLLPEDGITTVFRGKPDTDKIGVPVGVPEAALAANATRSAPQVTKISPSPEPASPPAIVAQTPLATQAPAVSPPPLEVAQANPSPPVQVAKAGPTPSEPPSPATGPDNIWSQLEERGQAQATQNPPATESTIDPKMADNEAPPAQAKQEEEAAAATEPKSTVKRKVTSSATKRSPASSKRYRSAQRPRTGSFSGRVVGTTPDGRLILLLPSGETRIVTPPSTQRRRPRYIIQRPRTYYPPAPYQPFEPQFPPDPYYPY